MSLGSIAICHLRLYASADTDFFLKGWGSKGRCFHGEVCYQFLEILLCEFMKFEFSRGSGPPPFFKKIRAWDILVSIYIFCRSFPIDWEVTPCSTRCSVCLYNSTGGMLHSQIMLTYPRHLPS